MKALKLLNRFVILIELIVLSLSYGFTENNSSLPEEGYIIGPASRTYLSMQAFTDLVLENIVLHQFDPNFLNTPIATMDTVWNGLPVSFQLLMHSSKVNSNQTQFKQNNDTYIISTQGARFEMYTYLTINGRNYEFPATSDSVNFDIFFKIGFDQQGLIFVNSTNATVSISNWTIAAGFFDPQLSKDISLVTLELPIEISHIPIDAIRGVISNSFSAQMTTILQTWLKDEKVYDSISLDRNLTVLPQVAGDKIMIERNMYFFNDKIQKQRPLIPLPTPFPKLDEKRHTQEETLMMNEYFFNSLFYSMFDANMLTYTLNNKNIPIEAKQNLTTYSLDHLFPGLKDQFDGDLPMFAEFMCTQYPKTTILGEILFFREAKVQTIVDGRINLLVDSPTGLSLIGIFDVKTHVELSMKIDVNQLFLFFENVQIIDFKVVTIGNPHITLDAPKIKNALSRLFLQSVPRLTIFLLLNHGIQLMPFNNVELINSKTDISTNHISTQTDLYIYDINKKPYQSFPALKLRAQNTLFTKLKNYLTNLLNQNLNGLRIPDIFLGSKFGCSVNVVDIGLPHFNIDVQNTYFNGGDNGLFNIHINNLSFEGKATIKLEEKFSFWGWSFKVWEEDVILDFISKPAYLDASINIQIDENGQFRPVLTNFDFSFKGGLLSIFIEVVCYVIDHIGFHNWIKNYILGKIQPPIKDIISIELKKSLQMDMMPIVADNISLDLQQTCAPIVKEKYIEVETSFFFTPTDIHTRPPLTPPILPDIISNDNDIEILIHEYSLNSIGYIAFTQNKLNYLIKHDNLLNCSNYNFTSTLFKWTIPQLYNKFGKDQPMNLNIESIFYPSISISSNKVGANVAALLDLQVIVPKFDNDGKRIEDEIVTAITIDCELDFVAKVFEENSVIKFSIDQISFSKLEAFAGAVEPGILFRFFGHTTVNTILNMAIPLINNHLFADKGIDLKQIIYKDYVELSNIKISLNQNYLFVATDADLI